MTPEQIELARHALGLTRVNRSFRNHFVAGEGHRDFANWMAMVANGDAKVRGSSLLAEADKVFWLTEEGAKKALCEGESLCPEDFPAKQGSA